jgi:hypothetical protein
MKMKMQLVGAKHLGVTALPLIKISSRDLESVPFIIESGIVVP